MSLKIDISDQKNIIIRKLKIGTQETNYLIKIFKNTTQLLEINIIKSCFSSHFPIFTRYSLDSSCPDYFLLSQFNGSQLVIRGPPVVHGVISSAFQCQNIFFTTINFFIRKLKINLKLKKMSKIIFFITYGLMFVIFPFKCLRLTIWSTQASDDNLYMNINKVGVIAELRQIIICIFPLSIL